MDSNIFKTPIYSGTHGNTKTAIAKVTSVNGELDRLMPVEAGMTILSAVATGAAGTVGYTLDSGTANATALDGAIAPFEFAEDGVVTYTPSADGDATIVITYV